MIEIVFVNKNQFWDATLKNLFVDDNLRYCSINELSQLSEWESVKSYIIILEEALLIQLKTDFLTIKSNYQFVKNWHILENISNQTDPLEFKQEVINKISGDVNA